MKLEDFRKEFADCLRGSPLQLTDQQQESLTDAHLAFLKHAVDRAVAIERARPDWFMWE